MRSDYGRRRASRSNLLSIGITEVLVNSIAVRLPTYPLVTPATLYYEQDYAQGNQVLDFLHLIRQGLLFTLPPNGDVLEEQYWHDLEPFRHRFAQACLGVIGNIDLLIDPPSSRGYHRPYVSAFKQAYPTVAWWKFDKTGSASADIKNLDALRCVTRLTMMRNKGVFTEVKKGSLKRLLIVDDVFAMGCTAAVIVEKVFGMNVPSGVEIHIAAPLRIPPNTMNKPVTRSQFDDILK